MTSMKNIRLTIAACLFVFTATTNASAVSFDSHNSQLYVERSLTALNSTNEQSVEQSEFEDIEDDDDEWVDHSAQHRALRLGGGAAHTPHDDAVPHKDATDGVPHNADPHKKSHATPAATKKGDACTTTSRKLANGKKGTGVDNCGSYQYTVFSQTWMPSMKFAAPKTTCVNCISANEARDWNKNLKIDGLRPYKSKAHSKVKKLPAQARAAINQTNWYGGRDGIDVYDQAWKKYGAVSGFTPINYVKEIDRLHKQHRTPKVIQVPKEKTVTAATLKKAFGKNACLVCKKAKAKTYFHNVRFCHQVDTKTHRAKGVVPFKHCGVCPKQTQCTGSVLIVLAPVV